MPRIAAVLTILPVFGYTALTGFSTSAVRAFIMITIYLISIAIGKNDLKLNTLFAAAILILLINPYSLFGLSFQLSFLSVLGILLVHSYYPFEIGSYRDKFKSALKTSVAASFVTLPYAINTFGFLPVLTVPANMLLVPAVELVIIPLGLISLIVFNIYAPFSLFILQIDSYFVSFLLKVTEWVDRQGLALVSFPEISTGTIFFLMLTGVILLLAGRFKRLFYLAPVSLAISITLGLSSYYSYGKGNLEVHIPDSGNKNIAVIRTPNNKSIVISGGYSRKSKSDFI